MSGSPNEQTNAARAVNHFSDVIAKVIDQFSASVWLPSALLVAVSWLILELRANGADLEMALLSMMEARWPESLILLVAVVAATVVQAISLDASRLLEGEWGDGRFSRIVSKSRCKRLRKRRNRVESTIRNLKFRTYVDARERKLAAHVSRKEFNNLIGHVFPETTEQAENEAAYSLLAFGDPDDIRRIRTLEASLADYPPADNRFLPTKLGNVLRAYEDRAIGPDGQHFEGDVSRIFGSLPSSLEVELDERRERLDLYCTLTIVSAVLGALALALLLPYEWLGFVGLLLGLIASWFFYRAAITSARGYGIVLLAMEPFINQQRAAKSEGPDIGSDDHKED